MAFSEILPLVLIAAFLSKHFLCDFVLQTRFQLLHKGRYGHPAGILHVLTHALGSLPVILIAQASPAVAIAVIVGECAVHYHLDWGKAQILRQTKWGYEQRAYWALFGGDQVLHGLTYVAMTTVLVART